MTYSVFLDLFMAVLLGVGMVVYALLLVGGRRFAGYALAVLLLSAAALFTTITAGAS
ncbi:hypothetical protein [Streptomyces sp. NPDC102487]|uniref:hypothetical protein n=1 Tax=Streptomyces sp. NPDC102487 TaxID=3366182 RepID=UPI0038202E5B